MLLSCALCTATIELFFSHIQLLLLHISNCTIPRIFSRMQPFFSETRGAFINNNWDFYLVLACHRFFFKCHIIFAMLRYYILEVLCTLGKGQLISKGHFSVFNSSKRTNLKTFDMPSVRIRYIRSILPNSLLTRKVIFAKLQPLGSTNHPFDTSYSVH